MDFLLQKYEQKILKTQQHKNEYYDSSILVKPLYIHNLHQCARSESRALRQTIFPPVAMTTRMLNLEEGDAELKKKVDFLKLFFCSAVLNHISQSLTNNERAVLST
ncbi:hypothetical protein CEXT_172571 [Caerostris extrusa]|uniref:Uncharacterized protein n=1 Tax=Caerostris extrusa TaxID=172846 RepID=A0AAV4VHP8_CAEEX|nr:hypothetical protein CEXT_172571 [Caerostris extrusa]